MALPEFVDLLARAQTSNSGPAWGAECDDLDTTLLVWKEGEGIAEHINDEVDVLIVCLLGQGAVTVDEKSYPFTSGTLVLVPKGARRSITAGDGGLTHLNVHKRRKRLMPGSSAGFRNRVAPNE